MEEAGWTDAEMVRGLSSSFQSPEGQKLLDWIDAYSNAPGDSRSCWIGEHKKLVCMTWRDEENSDDEA